ncbi:hypothetical protein HPT27_02180 [Permianibacter sp. IMCC34836]|uniref:hypothetical protein n=1 Tax=Permianibacter fluminis TaxID=2738515 RepID=UPI001552367E|nr:hypothetical protein [Permianibacter fluminis]NQD35811.1 hypothetical protein [Permianibacter fluminis]
MTGWQALETLADGRQLWRVPTALAGQFAPGQRLQAGPAALPILRADADALHVVAHSPPADDFTLQLTGSALVLAEPASLLLVTHDDGLFAALAWLFRHRRKVAPGTLRLLAVFNTALPFRPQPSRYLTPMLPSHVTAALPLLDDWQIVSRIAHPDGMPGCFDGEPEQLIAAWQQAGDRIMTVV